MNLLHLLHSSFKNSLKALKLLNLDCPKTRRMVNEIEEEADEIEELIDSFHNDLFNDKGTLLKYYGGHEKEAIIERIFGTIRHDLSVLSNKLRDLLLRKGYTLIAGKASETFSKIIDQ